MAAVAADSASAAVHEVVAALVLEEAEAVAEVQEAIAVAVQVVIVEVAIIIIVHADQEALGMFQCLEEQLLFQLVHVLYFQFL